jgi:hypothetical protein
MRFLTNGFRGLAAIVLAGAIVVAWAAVVSAQPSPGNTATTAGLTSDSARSLIRRIVFVPCDASALANAITAANSTPSTLQLTPGCTYSLTAALPQITGNVTLIGSSLSGGASQGVGSGVPGFGALNPTSIKRDSETPNIRILDVAAGGTLNVQGIFILGGVLDSGDGGGIRNAGTLTLSSSTVSGNTTEKGNGAGIYNSGKATITNSVILANLAIEGNGADINNSGDMTITSSQITGNVLNEAGGGIYTVAGHTTKIIQSTISGNTAGENYGGGIASAGTTTLDRSVVTLNTSDGRGSGIAVVAGGSVKLSNSNVSQNSPTNCYPAGSIPGCQN